MDKLEKKQDLLNKLYSYHNTPDDETIQYKQKIRDALMQCPEILYALNEESLEDELFVKSKDGTIMINWEWNEELNKYEPLGEWDRYFGESSNIRPFLFIPDTQTTSKNYICYQVSFDELPRYSTRQKYTEITFTIFVQELDRIDKETGIPRHDLIGSIIRERFNWSNLFGMRAKLIYDKESTTDTHYITRTLTFQLADTNGIVNTPYNGKSGSTMVNNYQTRR